MANQDFELRKSDLTRSTPAQQNRDAKEAARAALREAAAGYSAVVKKAGELIDGVTRSKIVNLHLLEELEKDVLELYFHTDRALLFENLQLVRFDNRYYQYHSVNVALLNAIIGEALGMSGSTLMSLSGVGLVIDIGMLTLPATILAGSNPLSDEEKQLLQSHPQIAVEILQRSGLSDPLILNAVRYHHERCNGTGYPEGLFDGEIPREARITAVSDSYDAASSKKRYRRSKSPFEVLAELAANENDALDSEIAETAAITLGEMLVGRHVILSDHSVGKVTNVLRDNLAYPEVVVVGRRIQTGPDLYPVSLSGYVPMF